MKRVLVVFIVIMVALAGCTINSNQQKVNQRPPLTKEKALNLVIKASGKVHAIVDFDGADIEDCTSENNEEVEIDGSIYNHLCSSLDTVEEFKAYYNDVLTEKSINSFLDNGDFKVWEGKLLQVNADIGGGFPWGDTDITSINQNEDTTVVEFRLEVSTDGIENVFTRKINYKYIENKGWRIDKEDVLRLY